MHGEGTVNFENPPLDEVVVGIQFERPPNFSTARMGEVWDLFRAEFPKTVDQPRLAPQFEIFGNPGIPLFQLNFNPNLPSRVWFIADDESHLLQFQDDRLLMNWRRRDHGAAYPRHPAMVASFKEYCERLNNYFIESFSQPISTTQAEVSYINMIPLNDVRDIGNWIKVADTAVLDMEQFGATFSEVIKADGGTITGRLTGEIQSGTTPRSMESVVRLSLTFRGQPADRRLETALSYITFGRDIVVDRFLKISTDQALAAWGKK